MNLILRMIYVFVLSRFRLRITSDNMVSELSLRVLPNDLDVNLHMNNGRYLTICDLNRVDLFIYSVWTDEGDVQTRMDTGYRRAHHDV